MGNSGRHESRSGGILGPELNAKREKWCFRKHEKLDFLFAPKVSGGVKIKFLHRSKPASVLFEESVIFAVLEDS